MLDRTAACSSTSAPRESPSLTSELSRFLMGAATAAHAQTLLSGGSSAASEAGLCGGGLGVVLLVSPHGLDVTYGPPSPLALRVY